MRRVEIWKLTWQLEIKNITASRKASAELQDSFYTYSITEARLRAFILGFVFNVEGKHEQKPETKYNFTQV